MTSLVLDLNPETRRFERLDGPMSLRAGETVRLDLHGLGVTADEANAAPDSDASAGLDAATAVNHPALRVRLLHPVYADVAMYPFPGDAPAWTAGGYDSLFCDLRLDVDQLFRVVRYAPVPSLLLLVERPWPHDGPTVYGTYPVPVEDWPDPPREMRVWPEEGRYVSALGGVGSLPALRAGASSLRETQIAVNAILGALKNLSER